MQGLRTLEGKKFETFFKIVQDEALTGGKIFFLDSGEGQEFETDDMEGENLSGWLVPIEKAYEFEKQFIKRDIDNEKWDDFFSFARWSWSNQQITITFS
ncbi:hypothetical protein [Hornefia butyriciproducens]|uniref:hypothetical protein n=1 Tax=Hornefia butyriciproducens TaxID=2652293 RepID=UPI0023F3D13D|nr:hypothetical protein [Hornefia butyriciproducens]MDD6298603.1 hypothetical protein [Hornefia butyriciproducens]